MTAPTSPRTTRALPAPWLRTTRWLLRMQLTVTLWTFGVIAVVALGAFAVVQARGIEPILSVVQFIRHPGVWLGFTLNLIAALGLIGLHVASGLTRRSFVAATVVVGLITAVVWAVVGALALELEGVVYAAQGWPQVAGEGGAEFDPGAGFAATVVPLALSFAAGQLSGLLVGMAYYRLGGWWATLALPLTVAPIFLVGIGGLDDGQWTLGDLDAPAVVAAVLGVLVLAAAAAAYHLIVRNVPIRHVEA
ncbi:hypothetical protein [Georgenia subflava]|uniref:Uncharacterized protein n=1 Tax=Georgenia subflava TaxID=1622177 RepID=A0A6N7EJ73_9MICO|nr:hypothetical protein [Georgenia subflava]MPV38219.1 hypothetical protein [Georgenia subflava]